MDQIINEPVNENLLDPERVFERRKAIIDAIRFELHLEEPEAERLETELEKAKEQVELIQEELDDQELILDYLREAADTVMLTLTTEQQAEIMNE